MGDVLATRPKPHTECASCRIRKLALFKGVALEDLQWTQTYRSNQLFAAAKKNLYEEDRTNPYAYTLFSGWVMLFKSLSSGKRQILRFALPGDFIGFQANLTGPMTHSARTVTECSFCAFPRDNLRAMFFERPDLAVRIAEMNARDMDLCQYHLLGAGRKSARERLAFTLLELFYRSIRIDLAAGASMPESIDFPVAQEELGDSVGLTTVHVNRTLRAMQKDDLITLTRRRLSIHDFDRLCEIGHFDPKIVLGPPPP